MAGSGFGFLLVLVLEEALKAGASAGREAVISAG